MEVKKDKKKKRKRKKKENNGPVLNLELIYNQFLIFFLKKKSQMAIFCLSCHGLCQIVRGLDQRWLEQDLIWGPTKAIYTWTGHDEDRIQF